ncbi:MAG: winged helix-turn-helix domain-containing protein [Vicinamibacterales bacterium]
MREPETSSGDNRVRFGLFDFDARSVELWKSGRLVPVRPQALKLLALLIARPREVVSRDEIQRALWSGDTFVDFEQGVNHAVRELRAALGDTAESPRFIQTLPRRGYRWLVPLDPVARDATPDAPPDRRERASVDSPTGGSATAASDAVVPPAPVVGGTDVTAPRTRVSRWAQGAVAVAAMVIAAVAWQARRPAATVDAAASAGSVALTVRPFVSHAEAINGLGLAHAIAERLGGQADVRSGGSLTPGAGSDGDATHVLSGDVTRTGQDVVVATDLRAANGDVTWTETFRVRADRIFDIEGVVAERVAGALRMRRAAGEQDRRRRRYTTDAGAYEDYLRGRAALVAYTPDGAQQAVRAFEAALARDPGYTLALAGLAMASADMYLRFAPPPDVEAWGARAETAARDALDRDGELAEAHLARAAIARKREFDWNTTIEASRRALILNPGLEQAHLFAAAAYYHLGYMDDARIALEQGRRLHGPDVVEPIRIEALVALFSGDFAPARARLEEVSRLSSQAIGDTYLALAYYYSGSAERGRAMLETLAAAPSASTAARAGVALAAVLAAQGDPAGARVRLARVTELAYRDHHVAYGFGTAYAQLRDVDQAVTWLRIAADTGFPCVPFFERDPLLDPLRGRAEFDGLLAYVRARRDDAISVTP